MGLLDLTKSLLRGPARGVMSSKKGNKNYYKGKGTGRLGTWTSRNKFIVQEWRLRSYMVPDLDGFEMTPYVSPKTMESDAPRSHTLIDYFKSPAPEGVSESVWAQCLISAKESQARLKTPKKGNRSTKVVETI